MARHLCATSPKARAPVRLLRLGVVDSPLSQALYHGIAEGMTVDTPDTLIVCRPRTPYLSLGYHQRLNEILDLDECRRHDLPVFRRRVGGGMTYLDSGQLFYQCIFHHSRLASSAGAIYERLLAAPVAALRRLGLNATLRADNEIEVDGRRIAGVGGARLGEACVVVGNLLMSFDFDAMIAVWNTPSRSFRQVAGEALRARLITLGEVVPGLIADDLEATLVHEFGRRLGRPLRAGVPSAREWRLTHEFSRTMSSPEYLALHAEGQPAKPMTRLKIAAGVFVQLLDGEAAPHPAPGSVLLRDGAVVTTRQDTASQPAEPADVNL